MMQQLPDGAPASRVALLCVGLMSLRAVLLTIGAVPVLTSAGATRSLAAYGVERLVELVLAIPLIVVTARLEWRWSRETLGTVPWLLRQTAWGTVLGLAHPVAMFVAMRAIVSWDATLRPLHATLGRQIGSEFPDAVLVFATLVLVMDWWKSQARLSAAALRSAELERTASDAQLRALQARLEPHFLYNALNTIGDMAYESPDRANTMLQRLSTLLRASLKSRETSVVPLTEELALLRGYIALQEARFGDHFHVSIDVDPQALDAEVPPLLLQPLVENAVEHGGAGREHGAQLQVLIRAVGQTVEISVSDTGGTRTPREGFGVGLTETRERLRLLFGDDAQVVAAPRTDGFTVTMTIPRHTIP